MPDRIVRDELLESDRWLGLKRNTHRLAFICLLLECDALGNLEATEGRLWRLWREPLALTDRTAIAEILEALVAADLIRIYASDSGDNKRYAHVPRTRFRLRWLTRIHPLSPWTTDEQKQKLIHNPPGEQQAQASLEPAKKGRGKKVRGGVGGIGTVGVNTSRLARATRLAADWQLPEDWQTWACTVYHLEPQRVLRISLAFRDYWIAKAKDATKLDWKATWRNWIRREMQDA